MTNDKAASPLQLVAILLFLLTIFPQPILSRKGPQPFKFLQHLEGCHKGQNVKGLHEVKQYLKKFGYASHEANPNSANDVELNDEFDDVLESEIKAYQLNYNLKVTGSLDAPTVKQMMMPRCGVPDVQKRGKKKNHEQSSSLHTVSHYAFFPGNPTWPPSQSHLTYRFSSSVPINVNIETLRFVCSRAFATWAAVTRFTFSEATSDDQQSDIVIGFHRGDHGDGYNFDGPGRTWAHAFSPRDGRFHYDADENWSTNPGPNMVDLESVAVHEIGHLLGLDHSLEPDAIMYAYIEPGIVKRELREDDIQGIRALYG